MWREDMNGIGGMICGGNLSSGTRRIESWMMSYVEVRMTGNRTKGSNIRYYNCCSIFC